MTDHPLAQEPEAAPSPNPQTPAAPSPDRQELLGQANATGAAPTEPAPQNGEPAQPAVLTGKHLVDFNGVPREMDIAEMAKVVADREGLETLRTATSAQLNELAAYKALSQQLEGMTDAQIQAFAQAAAQRGQQPPPPATDDLTPTPIDGQQPPSDPNAQQLNQLTQMVQTLAQREQAREQQHAQETLAGRVQELVGQFPTLNDGQKALVAQNAMLTAAQNPNADLSAVIAQSAATLVQQPNEPQVPTGQVGLSVTTQPDPNYQGMTAEDILGHRSHDMALSRLAQHEARMRNL